MKKTVVTFGLISGAISSAMMLATVPFLDRIGFERGEVFGYTMIVLSFLLVFFGIRSYRDNINGGKITFGRAFQVGILITLISCACYVITWEILYFNFLEGFTEKWTAYAIEKAKASGASAVEVEAQIQQMNKFKELYENPLINAAITFIEPFPVGLVITTLSAAVLRRRSQPRLEPTQTVVVS